jgi:MFS family permease
MADVLEGDRYAVATSVTGVTQQVAQLLGYLLGGTLLIALSPSAALLIDAATFAASAGWLAARLQRRPAPAATGGESRSLWHDTAAGLRFVAAAPRLRAIVGVLWVAALFSSAPEGIAAPLGVQLLGGIGATGLLLAANPAGATVGGILVGRFCPPGLRERLLPPLVVLSVGAVLLAGLTPMVLGTGPAGFAVVLVLLFLGGVGSACSIPLNVAFVQAVPSAYRGRAFGVAVAGLSGVQGLGAVLAGLAAERLLPSSVVVLCGALGLVAVVGPLLALDRTRPAGEEPGREGDLGHVAADARAEGRSGT